MTSRALYAAGLLSILLHGAGVWLLLPQGRRQVPAPAEPPTIEIEMIDQSRQVQGAEAEAGQSVQEPDRPSPPAGDETPPPPPPSRLAPPGRSVAAVNLGNANQDREALSVTGLDVVPPRPDARFRNQPPTYPADAARRGSEGAVGLRIHVTEAGIPAWIDVVMSSGDPSLDRAARDAAALWRFQPARNNGIPLPYDFIYTIRFSLGARP